MFHDGGADASYPGKHEDSRDMKVGTNNTSNLYHAVTDPIAAHGQAAATCTKVRTG